MTAVAMPSGTMASFAQDTLAHSLLEHLDAAGGYLYDRTGRIAGQLREALGDPLPETLRSVIVQLERDGWLWRHVEERLTFTMALAWVPYFERPRRRDVPPTVRRPSIYPAASGRGWRVVWRNEDHHRRHRFFATEAEATAFAQRPDMTPMEPPAPRGPKAVPFHCRLPQDLHVELARRASTQSMNAVLVDALRRGLER